MANCPLPGFWVFGCYCQLFICRMKVKELVKQLKKMPQELQVFWADHDHAEYETGGIAGQVLLIDKDEMNELSNDNGCDNFGKGYDPTFKDTPQQYVCLRPL